MAIWKYLRLGLTGGGYMVFSLPYLNHCIRHKEKHPIKERSEYIYRMANKMNRHALHMKLYVEGEDKIPEGQVIFTPNHVSACDPIVLFCVIKRPVGFIAKKEARQMPIVGKVLQTSDGQFLDRDDLRAELKVFKETLAHMKEEPAISYVIFPEGTRAKAPDFIQGPFHPGSFKLATRGGYPIVPVAMYFTERPMSPAYHYHKYPLQVAFLDPIMPEEYKEMSTVEIADIVSRRVHDKVEEMKARDPHLVKELNHYSDKKLSRVLFVREKPKKKKEKKAR